MDKDCGIFDRPVFYTLNKHNWYTELSSEPLDWNSCNVAAVGPWDCVKANGGPYGAIINIGIIIHNKTNCDARFDIGICGRGGIDPRLHFLFGAADRFADRSDIKIVPRLRPHIDWSPLRKGVIVRAGEKRLIYLRWAIGGGATAPAAVIIDRTGFWPGTRI